MKHTCDKLRSLWPHGKRQVDTPFVEQPVISLISLTVIPSEIYEGHKAELVKRTKCQRAHLGLRDLHFPPALPPALLASAAVFSAPSQGFTRTHGLAAAGYPQARTHSSSTGRRGRVSLPTLCSPCRHHAHTRHIHTHHIHTHHTHTHTHTHCHPTHMASWKQHLQNHFPNFSDSHTSWPVRAVIPPPSSTSPSLTKQHRVSPGPWAQCPLLAPGLGLGSSHPSQGDPASAGTVERKAPFFFQLGLRLWGVILELLEATCHCWGTSAGEQSPHRGG